MTALIYTIVKDWPADGASLDEQEASVRSSTIVQLTENAELIRETIRYTKQTSSMSGCEFVCVPVKIFPQETLRIVGGADGEVPPSTTITVAGIEIEW